MECLFKILDDVTLVPVKAIVRMVLIPMEEGSSS